MTTLTTDRPTTQVGRDAIERVAPTLNLLAAELVTRQNDRRRREAAGVGHLNKYAH